MTSIDTNVSNYTLSELIAIVELDDLEPQNIINNTNYFIEKYKNKNPKLSVFFQDVQSQLLQYAQGLGVQGNEDDDEDKIIVEHNKPKLKQKKPQVEGFENISNKAFKAKP